MPPGVTLRWPLPSAFITNTSRWKLGAATRSLSNVIMLPSGDQFGRRSVAGLFVSRTWSVPSAFMT